jgi:uncharacterized membrane protein
MKIEVFSPRMLTDKARTKEDMKNCIVWAFTGAVVYGGAVIGIDYAIGKDGIQEPGLAALVSVLGGWMSWHTGAIAEWPYSPNGSSSDENQVNVL